MILSSTTNRLFVCSLAITGLLVGVPGCGDDTSAVDGGAVDGGAADAGAVDSSAADGGAVDGSTTDAGAVDSSASDDGGTGATLRAFPGAEGYGKDTIGGRGGQVIKVTNLNDSGPGSLRAAIETTGPRTVLFEVGGLITINSALQISDPNISILGQSAPGDGIAITAEGTPNIPVFRISTDEVIIRYIRVRRSSDRVSETSSDGIYIESGENIIIDHCSVALSSDENLAIADYTGAGTKNITIQYCIISNPYGGSSKGALSVSGLEGLTFFRNAFISNQIRNPLIDCQDDCPDVDTYFEVINNVIYNAKYYFSVDRGAASSGALGTPKHNIINNYSKLSTGDPFPLNPERRMVLSTTTDPMELFVRGNISFLRQTITEPVDWAEEWSMTQGADGIGNLDTRSPASNQVFVPHATPIIEDGVELYDANDVWANIRTHVGASYPTRDSHDDQMVSDVDTGERNNLALGYPIPTYDNGTPYTDANSDGIEDAWFIANVPAGNGASDTNAVGYTYLEVFLNQLDD